MSYHARYKKKKITKVTKFIPVTSKSYGNKLKGVKIYYKGAKPKLLKTDGSFQFGKNIIEVLTPKFKKFKFIFTKVNPNLSTPSFVLAHMI